MIVAESVQLEHYLVKNKLLYNLQSGFTTDFATESCLVYLIDYLKGQLDNKNFTGPVMLYLQKAFDTVDHKILLTKLQAMGVKTC